MALIKPKKPATPPPAAGAAGDPAGDMLSLDDADPSVRRRAAFALSGAVPAVPALVARLRVEEDNSVREALLTALVRAGTPEVAAALVAFLDSEDAAIRNGAIDSLQQMPPGAVAPVLLPLLDDSDSDRRLFAVQLLGRLAHPERVDWLGRVIERDGHVNVCLAAVEALFEIGTPEALPALERLAARFPGDAFVAFQLDAARRRFGGR